MFLLILILVAAFSVANFLFGALWERDRYPGGDRSRCRTAFTLHALLTILGVLIVAIFIMDL